MSSNSVTNRLVSSMSPISFRELELKYLSCVEWNGKYLTNKLLTSAKKNSVSINVLIFFCYKSQQSIIETVKTNLNFLKQTEKF